MNGHELADKLQLVRCMVGDDQVVNEAETMLRRLQTERDLLFKAHSHEMVRADKLQIELANLKNNLEIK
jgi:hypothetical protein